MDVKSQIESLLFISARPMSAKQIAGIIGASAKEAQAAGDELVAIRQKENSGIQIIKNGADFQMVTSPLNSKLVREFIKDETSGELTRPSLEALTIIAYRGPISKIDLDRIRGVNCALILRNLLIRGLIETKTEKKEIYPAPFSNTRPLAKGGAERCGIYYNITLDFIRWLGINDVKGLPDYERLHKDDSLDKMLAEAERQNL